MYIENAKNISTIIYDNVQNILNAFSNIDQKYVPCQLYKIKFISTNDILYIAVYNV